jgi:hypothetical protein
MRNELTGTPRVILPIRWMNERVLLPAALRSSVLATVLFLWGDEDPNGGADITHAFTE